MKITDKKLMELQRIYKRSFGKDLSNAQAHEVGQWLINFVQIVYGKKV